MSLAYHQLITAVGELEGRAVHYCIAVPTLAISYRNNVLGQYWRCPGCGKETWEPVPIEGEKSH